MSQRSIQKRSPEAVAVPLLIVDDDPGSLALLSQALARPGIEILTASNADVGLDVASRRRPRIVLTTPQPGMADLAEQIVEMDSTAHIVRLNTHYASDEGEHTPSLSELCERVAGLAREIGSRQSPQPDGEPRPEDADFAGVVGRSPLMRDVFTCIRRIAPYYRAALITGDTGTGKDLVSQALHRLSPVSNGRYVVLNCSAVVETLFESELFGHVKGSFTGASQDKPGLFEHAHGGTLFLDEIGDMPLAIQAKLLRVLQNQEVQRVGSLSTRKVDVRVIAATNRDLWSLIAQKRLREHLYYRLTMVLNPLPGLVDRKEDLPLLQRHFIARFAAQYGKEIAGLTPAAELRLWRHSWPGNVRELENVIGHAAMMIGGGTIGVTDLPLYLQANSEPRTDPAAGSSLSLHEHERIVLMGALRAAGGNQSKAARLLRIGRDALRYKLAKHNLDAPEAEGTLAAAG